ncbi:MAG TPA: hypothetical protein VG895_05270 [Patescibacteria group bacterium]|nr:hypothetical protein [Patescibacteria group bacterium]
MKNSKKAMFVANIGLYNGELVEDVCNKFGITKHTLKNYINLYGGGCIKISRDGYLSVSESWNELNSINSTDGSFTKNIQIAESANGARERIKNDINYLPIGGLAKNHDLLNLGRRDIADLIFTTIEEMLEADSDEGNLYIIDEIRRNGTIGGSERLG